MCEVIKQEGYARYRGLMFRFSSLPLLFSIPSSGFSIHSWFVFFSFYAVWLDAHKQVIAFEHIFPFTFRRDAPVSAHYLLEVPVSHALSRLFSRR